MSRGASTVRDGNTQKAIYLSIIKGDMMQKVNEGVQGANKRTYEITDPKTQAVTEGHKWELQHTDVFGRIVGIEFADSKYGEQLKLRLYNEVDDIYIQIQTAADGRYGTDFLKKLPSLDLAKDICFNTFDFTPEGSEKKKTGVSIEQEGEKVYSFFYDPKKKTSINGLPPVDEAQKKALGKNYWKIFFITEFAFLKGKAEEIAKGIVKPEASTDAPEPTEEEVDDMPF